MSLAIIGLLSLSLSTFLLKPQNYLTQHSSSKTLPQESGYSRPRSFGIPRRQNAHVQLVLPVQHRVGLALHVEAIEFVGLEDKLLGLIIGYTVENDVQAPGHDAAVVGLSGHGVGLAAARDAVGEQQAVPPVHQTFDQRQGDVLEGVTLGNRLGEDPSEGGLDLLLGSVPEVHSRLGRRYDDSVVGYDSHAGDVAGELHGSQSTEHLDRVFGRHVVAVLRPGWLASRGWRLFTSVMMNFFG